MVGKHGGWGTDTLWWESMTESRGGLKRGDASSLLSLFFVPSIPSGSPALRWHSSNSGKTFFPQLFLFTDKSRNVPNPVNLTMKMNYQHMPASAATIYMPRPRLRRFISEKHPVPPRPLDPMSLSQSSSHKPAQPRCNIHRVTLLLGAIRYEGTPWTFSVLLGPPYQ